MQQGSMESTAIMNVKDINKCGEYSISCSEKKPMLCIADAITLRIHRPNAVKKEYSYNDLCDLESKLVLITGKYSTDKDDTKKFSDVRKHFVYYTIIVRMCTSVLILNASDIKL